MTDAAYFERNLDSLLAAIEAIEVSAYDSAVTSDGWHRTDFMDGTRAGTEHLETWLDLGPCTEIQQSQVIHSGTISFLHRFNSDAGARFQAQLHAAARDLMDCVQDWRSPSGWRGSPTSYDIGIVSASEWIEVSLSVRFVLPRQLPRS